MNSIEENPDREQLKHFLVIESIGVLSLLHEKPILFTEDEKNLLLAKAPILYSYVLKFPNDVNGFWEIYALSHWLKRLIRMVDEETYFTSYTKIDLHMTLSPPYLSETTIERLNASIANLSFVGMDIDNVTMISLFMDYIYSIINKFNTSVHKELMKIFEASDIETFSLHYSRFFSSYDGLLKGLSDSAERLNNIREVSRNIDMFSAVGHSIFSRLYPKEIETIPLDNFPSLMVASQNEKSVIWRLLSSGNTTSNFAPIRFNNTIRLKNEIATTTIIDFFVDFVNSAKSQYGNEQIVNSGNCVTRCKKITSQNEFVAYNADAHMVKQLLCYYAYNSQSLSILQRKKNNDDNPDIIRLAESYGKASGIKVSESFLQKAKVLFASDSFWGLDRKEHIYYISALLKNEFLENKTNFLKLSNRKYAKIYLDSIKKEIHKAFSSVLSEYARMLSDKKASSKKETHKSSCEANTASESVSAEKLSKMPMSEIPDDTVDGIKISDSITMEGMDLDFHSLSGLVKEDVESRDVSIETVDTKLGIDSLLSKEEEMDAGEVADLLENMSELGE